MRSVRSLRAQRGPNPPERILVSAARHYRRFNGSAAADLARLNASLLTAAAASAAQDKRNHSAAPSVPEVEIILCDRDDGPGTKLLCALDRLRALAAEPPPSHRGAWASDRRAPLYAVIADDDVTYKPWVFERLNAAISSLSAPLDAAAIDTASSSTAHSSAAHAYAAQASSRASSSAASSAADASVVAFDTFTLTDIGRAVTGGMSPGLLVSSGHAVVAIRIDALDPPLTTAPHAPPSDSPSAVREPLWDVSAFYRCVAALEPRATLHDDVWLAMFLQDVRGIQPRRISGSPFEMATRVFPESHAGTISFKSPGALNSLDRWAAAAARATVSRGGEFAAALLRAGNASSIDRASINVAMAMVRRRIRSAGLCGVRATNATPMCVGDWCNVSQQRDWGAHYSRMPAWP